MSAPPVPLAVPRAILDAVLAHCYGDHPVEACGMLAGPPGGPVTVHLPMVNAHASARSFAFDPAEQLAAYARLDTEGLDPHAIYHSHTDRPAYPSRIDIRLADPALWHLIVSTVDPEPEVRAYRIVDGTVTEHAVTTA